MATIKTEKEQAEIEDGKPISEAKDLGIVLGCCDGICGLCKIDVIEGEENCSKLSGSEEVWGMDREEIGLPVQSKRW